MNEKSHIERFPYSLLYINRAKNRNSLFEIFVFNVAMWNLDRKVNVYGTFIKDKF